MSSIREAADQHSRASEFAQCHSPQEISSASRICHLEEERGRKGQEVRKWRREWGQGRGERGVEEEWQRSGREGRKRREGGGAWRVLTCCVLE